MLVKSVVASTVGTTIEWYDFFLYSTVTPLVFAKLFFPNSDPLVGTLQAFLVYFVGFLARPVGALIFGHFGDRSGRKAALISTLLLMGIATFLVAFVPGYNMIGIWGAIILTALRFIQGVGVGGGMGRFNSYCHGMDQGLRDPRIRRIVPPVRCVRRSVFGEPCRAWF
jgi:MFS family permease